MRSMGKLSLTLIVVGTAACGSDNNNTVDAHIVPPIDAQPIDAPKVFNDAPPVNYDFTCLGNAAPTTAAAAITASGIVTQVDLQGMTPSIAPLDGATLDGCKSGAVNCTGPNHYGAQATSAGGGLFSIGPFDTGATPVDIYVNMTFTGDRPARVYPAGPLAADQPNIPVLTFTNSAFGGLSVAFGQMAANGTVGLLVADCANTPIADAANVTLSIKQGGNAVAGTTTLDASTLSAMAAGLYIVFNVPPGETEVGATYKGMTLRAHTVTVLQATDSETIVRPGF
jgi:hypothetical protein